MEVVMDKLEKVNYASLIKFVCASFFVIGVFNHLESNYINVEFFNFMSHEYFFIFASLALIIVSFVTIVAGIMVSLLIYSYILSVIFFGKSKRVNAFVNKVSQAKPWIPLLLTLLFVLFFVFKYGLY